MEAVKRGPTAAEASQNASDAKLVYAIIFRSGVPLHEQMALRSELRGRLAKPGGREELRKLAAYLHEGYRRTRLGDRDRAEHEMNFTDCEANDLDIPGVEGHRGDDGDGE